MLLVQPITVRHFTDPGCPWAYSASPALATLRWRYGAQIDWRLTLIGLTERAQQYVDRGYTPQRQARGYRNFRQYGMPFQTQPKHHVAATSRACRAVVAALIRTPRSATPPYARCTHAVHDAARARRGRRPRHRPAPGTRVDAPSIVARIDDPDVVEAYEADRALARTAAGSPTEFQGKSAATDGPVRYTAPSLVFERDGTRLEAGGFQPIEAYDVVLANFDTTLERRAPAEDPLEVLEEAPHGLVTAEVAEIMRPGLFPADRGAAEDALIDAAARGEVVRVPVGDDAVLACRALRARVRQVHPGELHGRRQRRHAAGRRVVDRAQGVADAADALARQPRVVAAGLELDGDVDDAAGVGDEVRRPQHAVAREQIGDRLIGEWLLAAPATTGACSAGTDSSSSTAPSAHGARTSTGASSAFSGLSQRAPSRAASSRLRASMSETTSLAPRRARSRARRRPTAPSPTIAALRPFREVLPKARSTEASTAASTPSAV